MENNETNLGLKSEYILTKWILKLSSDTAAGNILWTRRGTDVLLCKEKCKPIFVYKLEKHIHPTFHLPEFSFSVIYSDGSYNAERESISLKLGFNTSYQETIRVFEDGESKYDALVSAIMSLEDSINKFYSAYSGISFRDLNSIRFFLNNALFLKDKETLPLNTRSIPAEIKPFSVSSRQLLLQLIKYFKDYTSFEKLEWHFVSNDIDENTKKEYFHVYIESPFSGFSFVWSDKNVKSIELHINALDYEIFDSSWEEEYYPELKAEILSLREIILKSYEGYGDLKSETMNYIKRIERNLLK